jgi:ABC-type bacteriocin/lantibiotic exporter with double-glycine peptidase domain
MKELSVHNLEFLDYGPFSFTVSAEHNLSIHGQSGAGKTLLLRALADLDEHTGEILLGKHNQQELPPSRWRKNIGYLPSDAVFWNETMAEYFEQFEDADVFRVMQTLNLEPLLNMPLNKLSSGEKQRFALLRLLANQPQALLLDEPTSHLDPDSVSRAEQLILDYQQAHDCPLILVSHDKEQCRRMTRQSLTMQNMKLRPS